jgi:hypothetical protein
LACGLLAALLGCVAFVATASADQSMTFRVVVTGNHNDCRGGCVEVIAADGEINNETAGDFLSFLADHLRDRDLRPVVLLQSPGGTVVGAMQLGTVFRKLGAAVIVAAPSGDDRPREVRLSPGVCLSACVYAFFGGKKRVVPPASRLGIHRMVINEPVRDPSGEVNVQRVFGSEELVAALSGYTKSMGVDPRVIQFAERIPPDQIHIVTPAELRRWHMGSPRL